MTDDSLKALTQKVWEFREARDWGQFHHPKELASALSIEVAEIMELFRFKTPNDVAALLPEPEFSEKLGNELADSLFLLLLLGKECGLDLHAAFERKLALLETRYPLERSRGSNAKWTEYQEPDGGAGGESGRGK